MRSTSWLDYLRADNETRLVIDAQSQANRTTLAEIRKQTDALERLYGVRDDVARVESAVENVTGAISDLGALFTWTYAQIHAQFNMQTKQLDNIGELLSHPLKTQAQELWDRSQWQAERGLDVESVKSYSETLALDPLLYPAQLQLGFIRAYKLYEFDAAMADFAQAARYATTDDPEMAAQARFHLYKLQRETGQPREAWDSIVSSTQLDPEFAPAWWERATLAAERGCSDETTNSLTKAILLDPVYWNRAKEEPVWAANSISVASLLDTLFSTSLTYAQDALANLEAAVGAGWQAANHLSGDIRDNVAANASRIEKRSQSLRQVVDERQYATLTSVPAFASHLTRELQGELEKMLNSRRAVITKNRDDDNARYDERVAALARVFTPKQAAIYAALCVLGYILAFFIVNHGNTHNRFFDFLLAVPMLLLLIIGVLLIPASIVMLAMIPISYFRSNAAHDQLVHLEIDHNNMQQEYRAQLSAINAARSALGGVNN